MNNYIPLHIDFETFSEVDLKKVGTYAYSIHPSTECLMMAYAIQDQYPKIWLPSDPYPDWVNRLFNSHSNFPYQIHAWNDLFEYFIMKNVLKWPVPPIKYWIDTAASATALSLPRSLEECCKVLNVPNEFRKKESGKHLIKLFSIPQRRNKKVWRIKPEDEPEKFNEFKDYCIYDVISDRYVYKTIKPLSKINRKSQMLDRKINIRGVHFDISSVKSAIKIRDAAKIKRHKKVLKLTNGKLSNINSPSQFVSYCRQLGVNFENSQKEYLKREIKKLEEKMNKCYILDYKKSKIYKHIIDITNIRLSISKASLAKYDKLLIITNNKNKAYGLLRWHGAGTGRWSGNLFQPHNLQRPSFKNIHLCAELFKYENHNILDVLYGDSLEALASSIRAMIIPSEGNRLVVSDFSQIESRVLKWQARDEKGLSIYIKGKDIYKFNAAAAFKVKYENVTDKQRTIGKVIELACGYQGALGAFKNFADDYGVVIPDNEALKLIKVWRSGNPKIVKYWYNLEAAVINAIKNPGSVQSCQCIKFTVRGTGSYKFLYMLLPSGRLLAYHKPEIIEKRGRFIIYYYGPDSKKNNKYGRQQMYGGKIAQNATEGIATDRLIYSMHKIEESGYPIILSVHDEIISDVPKGHGSIEEFNNIMKENPPWAKDLPVDCDGYEAMNYKKG